MSRVETYYGVDPGNGTGLARLHWGGEPSFMSIEIIEDMTETASILRDVILVEPYPDAVFVEDWQVRPDTHRLTRQPAVYKLLGWLEIECLLRGIEVHRIQPAEHSKRTNYKRKRDSLLVPLGWHRPSKDKHFNSAGSVLLTGLIKHRKHIGAALLASIDEGITTS